MPSMLAAQGIIGAQDLADIQRGMAQITAEIEGGQFEWKLELEDVHLNIEARLTQLVGDAGKRLHTGRSRNDQVATDVRLWLRGEIDALAAAAGRHAARAGRRGGQEHRHRDARLHPPAGGAAGELCAPPAGLCGDVRARRRAPGRRAQALSTACRWAPPRWPAPATRWTAPRGAALGFDGVCENSLDAVSDRDFAIEFLAFASITMVHVSAPG
jgi:argininosuccinate lyase